jgi:broad specificity phosphatase PhoE
VRQVRQAARGARQAAGAVMADLREIQGAAELYFIRHGESEGNRDGIIQGRNPSRLTHNGRSQAKEAGDWFRSRSLDLILTSPLARALETAEIIAAEAGVTSIRTTEELTEIDTGIFSGLTFEQAERMHPEAWRVFQRESWEGVPQAERIAELLSRAEKIWSLLALFVGQGQRRVLCVTHSGFLQWIVRSTLGSRSWMPLFSSSGNCCVSHLRVANSAPGDGYNGHLATWMMINSSIR